jgi:mycothiol synthase
MNGLQAVAIMPETIILRPPAHVEMDTVQQVWSESQDADEPLGRPAGGWWSVMDWATSSRVLVAPEGVIGVAAVEYRPGAEAAEARVALLPAHRHCRPAVMLIRASIALARDLGAPLVRLYMPIAALWATAPARASGFNAIREQHVMLRPAGAGPLQAVPVAGVQLRPLADGEEAALLEFLNHAWAGTWNFRPITAEALASDLEGQRPGMLVAVDDTEPARIVGTCHAIYDPAHRNPDGHPYAWISNLTTHQAWRGRGLGRALLVAGIEYLHAQGASSIALGVDGGAAAPVALYRSAGFATISAVAIWERPVKEHVRRANELRIPWPSHVSTPVQVPSAGDGAVDARAVSAAVGA